MTTTYSGPVSGILDIYYKGFLELISDPENKRDFIARELQEQGLNVQPGDFRGARLITGPEDKEYLQQRYGDSLFFPSTIYVPEETWHGQNGRNGLGARFRVGNHRGALLKYGVSYDLPITYERDAQSTTVSRNFTLYLKFMTGPKSYHEDFHESWHINRALGGRRVKPNLDDSILGEVHAMHSDVDLGLTTWDADPNSDLLLSGYSTSLAAGLLDHQSKGFGITPSDVEIEDFKNKLWVTKTTVQELEGRMPDADINHALLVAGANSNIDALVLAHLNYANGRPIDYIPYAPALTQFLRSEERIQKFILKLDIYDKLSWRYSFMLCDANYPEIPFARYEIMIIDGIIFEQWYKDIRLRSASADYIVGKVHTYGIEEPLSFVGPADMRQMKLSI